MSSELAVPVTKSARRQVRRAWIIIAIATAIFTSILIVALATAYYVYQHATVGQPARMEVVSGSGVLWRSSDDEEWKWVTEPLEVQEGDQISTTLGTTAEVTMFDGSSLEVAEDSVIELERMRASRFTDNTKLIKVRPLRGTAYVSMTAHGRYGYGEFIVESSLTTVVMADGSNVHHAGTFLVELIPTGSPGSPTLDRYSARVAVLEGQVNVSAGQRELLLASNQQVIFAPDGQASEVTPATREFVRNGTFEFGLAGWEIIENSTPADAGGAQIAIVPYSEVNAVDEAVEFRTSDPRDMAGIEQKVGQTLRVSSELTFSLEIKLLSDAASSALDEGVAFPLTVELHYLDERGAEQVLRRSFYSDFDSKADIPNDIASPLSSGVWELVVFDLNNLKPLPVQISSIVLYASGGDVRSQVANVSLTSSELLDGE